MTQSVANRYVTALADVVTEPGSGLAPEKALRQLQSFSGLLAESGELEAVLTSPSVSPSDKGDLLTDIGARIGLSPVVRTFLHVLVDHRRIAHFGLVLQGFRSWLDDYRNRVEMEVRVAAELAPAQRVTLERRFRTLTGKEVRARYLIDPDVIGGSSVRIGSMLYDGTVKAALGSLANELAAG